MKYVVNADDFGIDESVSAAILECFKRGFIDRTTMMVNMPYSSEAAQLAREEHIADKVGLHINLTSGVPLTNPIRNNPLICDSKGLFNAAFARSTKYRLYLDEQTVGQIKDEIRAQIEKYISFNFTLMHVDSHHHVHNDYPVFRALKALSREYDFSSVRIAKNLYNGGNPVNRVYKSLYNSSLKKICAHTGDYFGAFHDLKSYSGKLTKGSTEIMVHPMYMDGRLIDNTDECIFSMDEEYEYLKELGYEQANN